MLPGCTALAHLERIVEAAEARLSPDVEAAIEAVHAEIKNPVV